MSDILVKTGECLLCGQPGAILLDEVTATRLVIWADLPNS